MKSPGRYVTHAGKDNFMLRTDLKSGKASVGGLC